MDTRNKQHRWLLHLLGAVLLIGFTACSSSSDDDDIVIDADSGKFVEVPDPDTWVTDDDIKSEDLDQLVDLSVKVERIRQEFVLMLSNGGEGDKLFCGVGPKTDVEPTINIFTEMMLKQDKVLGISFAHLDNLHPCRCGSLKTLSSPPPHQGQPTAEQKPCLRA